MESGYSSCDRFPKRKWHYTEDRLASGTGSSGSEMRFSFSRPIQLYVNMFSGLVPL